MSQLVTERTTSYDEAFVLEGRAISRILTDVYPFFAHLHRGTA